MPFEFDVHAMVFSQDAPGLEKQLHRHFVRKQLNKVNPRKEYFKVGLPEIRVELEKLGVETHWTMKAEAHEYRESLKVERQLVESAEAEREWLGHPLEYEPEDLEEVVESD